MKYDRRHISRLLNSLAEGDGRVRACQKANVTYQTFINWMNDPSKKVAQEDGKEIEFFEAVEKSEECAEDLIKDLAKRSVIERMTSTWQAGAWWLERNYPEEFRVRTESSVTLKAHRDILKGMFDNEDPQGDAKE